MAEFLHEVVAKRNEQDLWSIIERGQRVCAADEAAERLLQWLIEQRREEDNANV